MTSLMRPCCRFSQMGRIMRSPYRAAALRHGLRRCLCTPALASKTGEAKLSWVPSEHRRDVAQILEQAERAAMRWEVTYTNFYTPPVVADAVAAMALEVADCVAVPWGGYAQAERCR